MVGAGAGTGAAARLSACAPLPRGMRQATTPRVNAMGGGDGSAEPFRRGIHCQEKEVAMRPLGRLVGVCVLAISAVMAGGAWGQDDPRNTIAYRQGVMKSLAAHMGAIGAVVNGKVGYWNHIIVHAVAIDGVNRTIPELFPRRSGPDAGPTRARPEIWQTPDQFRGAARQLAEEAARLVDAARSGNPQAISTQFANVGNACGACHKRFRAKKR